MTPDRWRRVCDLFDAALRLTPADREPWLREACGREDDLRAEVERLLDGDERAARDGFLTPPAEANPGTDVTGSWPPRPGTPSLKKPGQNILPGDAWVDDSRGFTPRRAIAPSTALSTVSEPPDLVRARLRELPMVYILSLTATAIWTRSVFGPKYAALHAADALVILALGGLVALLWGRRPIPLAGLKALELGVIGLVSGYLGVIEYRLMLEFSLRGETMMAQMTLRGVVLLTSVLILTYGLYVPKSWRRAAVVVVPLALLPFAPLPVLALRHPATMAWIGKGSGSIRTPPVLLFTYDGLILVILAVCATLGARTISLLRREAAEARRLGQYQLRARIGAGGMGEVYLAEHHFLKRPCAVKLIRADVVNDPKAQARFEREVQITASLSHPNIVEVYDYGRAEDGTYYYVMEYLPGLSLEELVRRHGPLPPARVVYLLRQVCQALHVAHAAGLIHRDVKPSNVIAARRSGMVDVVKLLDFGLVRTREGSTSPHLTGEGQVLGTPQFMAPEQVMSGGRVVDERSDLYALGAVAYFLLTGRPPFDGGDGIGVMVAHARDPVVPPSKVCPGVPDDLERVVLSCLAKDPAERFADAEGLERSLAACACAGDWDRDRAARWWSDADSLTQTVPKSRLTSMA
jgi:serine/threonine-protein kinase